MRTSRRTRQFTIFVLYLPCRIGLGFLSLALHFVLARGGVSVGAVVEVG